MTNAEIIDIVLLRVGGGKLSQDMNVMREDVLAMIAPTAAYLMTGDAYNKKAAGRLEVSTIGVGDASLAYMGRSFLLPPVEDAARSLYYVDVPGTLVPLPGNDGVFSASPKNGIPYIKTTSQAAVNGLGAIANSATFFWTEKTATGARVYLKNLPLPVCDVLLLAATITADSENDEPGVPKDMEVPLIEKLVQHFMEQRQAPADLLLDGKDVNEQR